MKLKSLLPLVVVLAVLVGLILFQKSREKVVPISEQVGLVSLMPEGLSSSDIKKIDLYNGAKPDEKVTLAWDAAAEKWRIPSHFNAPVNKEKIEEFVTALSKLKGELRTEAATDADLEQYGLSDAKAFHVDGYEADGKDPSFRLLVGKAPAYGTVFMRSDQDKNVYVESVNLRQQAGVTGGDEAPSPMPGAPAPPPATGPEAKIWVDTTALKLEKDSIQKIELTTPDKHLAFELREKKTEAPAAPEADKKPEDAATPPPAAKVEHEWALASGGFDPAFKQQGLDALARKLEALTATDVVDPAKKAEWGLEPPAFTCAVTIKGQDQPTVIEGGRPDPSGDGYIRVSSAKDDLVYKVNSFTFEQVFPKGTDLFTLPALNVDSKTIDKIELAQPEGKVELTKVNDAWTVDLPKVDLKPATSTLQSVATALAAWRPADYADAPDGKGLDAPTRTVTFSAGPGVSHTIALGADAKGFAGAYAKLDGGDKVLAMSKSDLTRIFVKPNDVFERTLGDLDEESISEIRLEHAAESFTATRQDTSWVLTIGGAPAEANRSAIDAVASALATLQASDILFDKTNLDGPADATLTFKTTDGKELTYTFGPEENGKRQLKASNKNELFAIESASAQLLLPAADTLKQTPPPPLPAASEPATSEPALPSAPDAGNVMPAVPSAPGSSEVVLPAAPSPEPTTIPVPAAPAPAEVTVPATPAPPPTTVPAPAAPVPAAEAPNTAKP